MEQQFWQVLEAFKGSVIITSGSRYFYENEQKTISEVNHSICFFFNEGVVHEWQQTVMDIFDPISTCFMALMGVRRGGQGGALAPPGRPRPAKNSMYLDFFGKNCIVFVVF
jgi:hypothetical protein